MDSHQILDSLTSHIALYHHSPNPNPNPNPRSSILRWFSSLSVPHRQSSLTILDPDFVRILLQMQSRLLRHGHGFFFLLLDLPSPSSLPSLCFRRSKGLLARHSASNDSELSISRSIRLFGSRESGQIADSPLDSLTFSEDFVSDVGRFVEVMDGVSGGRFLRGDDNGWGSQWVELPWLKDKGYYSLEVFVANKIEVALRLAWANCHGGKKQKGMKSKEKAAVVAGVAANAFWRKKGCLDWWMGLDPGWRETIFLAYLGKAAKSLANDIVEGPSISLKNESGFLNIEAELQLRHGPTASWQRAKKSFFRRDSDFCLDIIPVSSSGIPHTLAKFWNRLLVVQEISSILLACRLSKVENETLFFSTLGSALTVSDCIMRILRGLLMVVSIDYINLELMGDEKLKTLPNKPEEKVNVACSKGKKKCRNSKRLNSMPKKSRVISTLREPSMDNECRTGCVKDISSRVCHHENTLSVAANQKTGTVDNCVIQNDLGKEQTKSFVDCNRRANKKKNGGKGAKSKTSNSKKVVKSEHEKTSVLSIAAESELAKSVGLADTSTVQPISNNFPIWDNPTTLSSSCDTYNNSDIVDGTKMTNSAQADHSIHSIADNCFTDGECCPSSDISEDGVMFKRVSPCLAKDENIPHTASSCPYIISTSISCDRQIDSSTSCSGIVSSCDIMRPFPTWDLESTVIDNKCEHQNSEHVSVSTSQSVPPKPICAVMNDKSAVLLNDGSECYAYNHMNSMGGTSYEWPNITPLQITSVSSHRIPAATDRLHLDVGHKRPNNFHQSFIPSSHQARNSSTEGGHSRILPSLALPMSCDWPPMVKSCNRLSQTVTISYDSAFTPALPPSFCSGFAAHAAYVNGAANENDRKHSGDIFDVYDLKNASELADDTENYWWSEEESETYAFSGRDYNQFFGGGVMYWNPAEHIGTGFSRPPSHSSEDSSWAWYEADLNRAIDDMVGMPGLPTSYNTNGLASPPAAPFCSPFDPLGSGHQSISYAIPGNDGGKVLHSSLSASDVPEEKMSRSLSNSPGCVEGMKGDALPYQLLRPIIVPSISRKGSRSEFKLSHDHKSPCLSSTRREHPRIKRPPSPVVLCVPRVPRPPPPSPVGESRRGIPIVRSGSSSPRYWGMRSSYNEDGNSEETHLCLDGAEVVWPSWGNKDLAGTPVARSIQGSLLQDHLITISQLARDQEHPDVSFPVQPPDLLNCPNKASLSVMHNILHEEIDFFCKQVAAENLIKKPYINWAVKRVTRSLQVLWPRSRTNIFGSNATGLSLPSSDVDLVVSLPPVRNLEPIKEAGILEGRNGIKETCLQHAARYLANQEWVRNDSLKTVENTAIPVIMLVAEVPQDIKFSNGNALIVDTPEIQSTEMPGELGSASRLDHTSSENTSWPMCSKMKKDGFIDVKSIRLDISFKSPSHTGLQTSELVRELTQQFPACVPLALVLKKFLADRSLDHSYSGGLSSYCLVLLITRFLQHEHHIGRPINQNLGSLLMDFLYFFGNIFDPRQMRISIQGSGVYMNRERGHSIDPIHIDDPLFPSNNVGRNCFRIHQCIKAFADAYTVLENELSELSANCGPSSMTSFKLLQKIIPSVGREE